MGHNQHKGSSIGSAFSPINVTAAFHNGKLGGGGFLC